MSSVNELKKMGNVEGEPKELTEPRTGKKVYTRGAVHRDFAGLTGLVEGEKAQSIKQGEIGGRRPFDYSQVEMVNGDNIIYGIDEIGSIYGLYGKDSEIYNAMAEGKVVSPMIEESMKKNQEIGNEEIAKREESLLARCLKREKEQGLEI